MFGLHVHEQQHNAAPIEYRASCSIVLCISTSVVCMTSRQGSLSFYAKAFNPRDSLDDNSVARMFARVCECNSILCIVRTANIVEQFKDCDNLFMVTFFINFFPLRSNYFPHISRFVRLSHTLTHDQKLN